MGVDPQQNPSYSNPSAAGYAVATASSSSVGVPITQARGRKRKLNTVASYEGSRGRGYDALDVEQPPVQLKKQKAKADVDEEKRLRKYELQSRHHGGRHIGMCVANFLCLSVQIPAQSSLQFRCRIRARHHATILRPLTHAMRHAILY